MSQNSRPRGPKSTLDPKATAELFSRLVRLGAETIQVHRPQERYKYYRAWLRSPWSATHCLSIEIGLEGRSIVLIAKRWEKR